jgi:phospholipid transport system substrate-binding protein
MILLGSSLAIANPAQQSQVQQPQKQTEQKPTPADIFKEGIYQLQKFMRSDQMNDEKARDAFISQQIQPKFDLQKMAKLVAGKHYRHMSPEQKTTFTNKLGQMFFRGFTDHLVSASGEQPKIRLLKKRINKDEQLIDVLARALYPDGKSTRLVFRFANSAQGWRVYDVSADGSSAVLYYRQHFTQLAKQLGPEAMLQ